MFTKTKKSNSIDRSTIRTKRFSVQPVSQLRNLKAYSRKNEISENALYLDANENQYGCSPRVIQALQELQQLDLTRYPVYTELIDILAKFNKISSNCLFLTNGGDEAIRIICDGYLSSQDQILLLNPSFSMYRIYAQLAGAKIVEVAYKPDMEFPKQDFLTSITPRTKLIFIGNPNNPTGELLAEDVLEQICKRATSSLIIIDEAYIQFSKETLLPFLQHYPNLVFLRSFSKAFGLASIRLGYIIADEKIISVLQKVKSPYNVNKLAVVAGLAALNEMEYYNDIIQKIVENREYLTQKLKILGLKVYPSAANFLLVDFGEICNYIFNRLKKTNIVVRKFAQNSIIASCLRITVGTKSQCQLLIRRIRRFMEERRGYDNIRQNSLLQNNLKGYRDDYWRH